jgi:hypothetical protein
MPAKRICLIAFIARCYFSSGQSIPLSGSAPSDSVQTEAHLEKQIEKTIKLSNDIEISVGRGEIIYELETFTLFMLTHKKKLLYLDTSLTEYEFSDKLYPMVRALDGGTIELLVEINNRPNKNYLKHFIFSQDKLLHTDSLPIFISTASNLDADARLELAGYWDVGETWGDNNEFTAYNPIIYYELLPNGIVLDSTLTHAKNQVIYGQFYGYAYNENIQIDVNKLKKRDAEIARIRKK